MVANGHQVVVETGAGEGPVIQTVTTVRQAPGSAMIKRKCFECDVLVKSAPVSEEECDLLKPNQYIISPITWPL